MLHLVRALGFCIFVGFATFALARTDPVAETKIQAVISQQLDALDKNDSSAAFAIASPKIQTLFQTAEFFIDMVERGYPQLRHSRGHRFLKLDWVDGVLIARVLVDSDSGSVIARYEMIEIDGVWRINGCSLEPRQDT